MTARPTAVRRHQHSASQPHSRLWGVGADLLQLPQRVLGRDLFWWLTRLRLMTKTADSRLARRMRTRGDMVIGAPLGSLRRAGVSVRPRVVSIAGDEVAFVSGPTVRASTVVWATGFRSDYSWVDVPDVFDEEGNPSSSEGSPPSQD